MWSMASEEPRAGRMRGLRQISARGLTYRAMCILWTYRNMQKVYDVPDGQGGKIWRWTRAAAPMRLTLVNGVATFENGKFTGELPGQLLSPSLPAAV